MENSYPLFHKYYKSIPLVAMSVQGATRSYINPKTGINFTNDEFINFGVNYLGASIIIFEVE
jgi:hypothetical protein